MENDVQGIGNYVGFMAWFAGIFIITCITLRIFNKPKRRLPPSIRSLPFVGSMPFLPNLAGLPKFFLKTTERLGPVLSLKIGSLFAVVLNSKEAIHEALIKNAIPYANRESYTVKFLNPGKYGIMDKYYGASFRKNLQLTLSILKEFGFGSSLMEQRILTEAEELITLIKAHNGKPLYPAHFFSMAALNVIASIIFGQRLSQTDEKLSELCTHIHLVATSKKRFLDYYPALRFLPHFKRVLLKAVQFRKSQIKFVDEGVEKSLASTEDSFTKRFVESQGSNYDRAELLNILRDLLAAGSETTASSLQWATVLMANNQDIQKRLQKDIDSVVTHSRSVNLDDAVNLPYVEAAILELTRIKTVVPLALLHFTIEDTEVGGYFIPKNTTVIPNLYAVHMNPLDWPEPEVYRPERFISDDGKVFGKDKILPFSLGKRSCTGEFLARQELFLFFTTLLQHFDILPPEGEDKVECEENFHITMCPTKFEVRIIPRDI